MKTDSPAIAVQLPPPAGTAAPPPAPESHHPEKESLPPKDARPLAQEARIPRPLPPPLSAPPPRVEPAAAEGEPRGDVPPAEPQAPDDAPGPGAEGDGEVAARPEAPPAEPPPEPPEPRPAEASEASEAPPAEPALDLAGIPLVQDLPAELKEALSDLTINVHGYFENPERRVVFINMRRYRVGDRVGDQKYLIEAITPEGVVLNYGDGRARLLVKR